ncbi:ultraviolet-B receptor UVR8 isoform X1 [Selaginella moellendorffii]|uniref:ultraviolet-B receptor UVR8 isoform X1 n=1 Tax=Selaginella moellendorffii TaxID=88036 RepID=UPI000D1CC685|nr:ultraviolet-B receptor UVR8 isoform X1 [Selaginella moellendorffii]|eukprot:XP_024542338.1 ultraviolet-B receptor UVR8 isoform X1 [Selaginella moellendorffii]
MAVWSWGAGTQGQLGLGTMIDALLPQAMDPPLRILDMACGGAHAAAILDGGRVATWGRGLIGHEGDSEKDAAAVVAVPSVVEFFGGHRVCEVAAGWNHTAFVTESGELFTCGDGAFGQLGHGDFVSRGTPCKVLALSNAFKVACGMRHTLVLSGEGDGRVVKAFGLAKRGQLGSLSSKELNKVASPQAIPSLDSYGVSIVAANGDHSAALSVASFISGEKHLMINRVLTYRSSQVKSLSSTEFLSAGTMALVLQCPAEDGEAISWGTNRHGQLGSSRCISERSNIKFYRVQGLEKHRVVSISAGSEHSAAVDAAGDLYTWGWGEHGQLGLGHVNDERHPCRVVVGQCQRSRVCCGSGFTFAFCN